MAGISNPLLVVIRPQHRAFSSGAEAPIPAGWGLGTRKLDAPSNPSMLPSIDRSFTRPAGHPCDRSGGANAGHDRPNNLFPLMELRMPRALSTRIAAAA